MVSYEDSTTISAFLVVHSRLSGFSVLVRFDHDHVSLHQAPEGMGYRCKPQSWGGGPPGETPASTERGPLRRDADGERGGESVSLSRSFSSALLSGQLMQSR